MGTGIFEHGEAFDVFTIGAPIVLIAIVALLRSQGRTSGFNPDTVQVADRRGDPANL